MWTACGGDGRRERLSIFWPARARWCWTCARERETCLQYGTKKFQVHRIQPVETDALLLPLRDNSIDLVVSAFGFRNLANYDTGLQEIRRVLKPGGEFGILDFSEPGGLLGKFYGFYFRKVLPRIGTLISGVKGAYEYLPASVKTFPTPQQMVNRMEAAGFRNVSWTKYTFGIAGLYRGIKPATGF